MAAPLKSPFRRRCEVSRPTDLAWARIKRRVSRESLTRRRFERSFHVPSDVLEEKIEAQFGDGVLKVTLPRNAPKELAVKKVEIKK